MLKKKVKICDKRIDEIAKLVAKVKKAVNDDYREIGNKEKTLESNFIKKVEFIPSPIQIAKYFGLRCVFKELEQGVPSYFNREELTIYISNRYVNDSYITRHLCAHELGHFFLHERTVAEMNKFSSKVIEEYEANVFSIFLMPQIMGGYHWETFSPEELNAMLFDKVFKQDG